MQIEEKLEKIEKQLQAMSMQSSSRCGTNYGDKTVEEIDLRELCNVLWKGKWLIVSITMLFTMVSVMYALSLPNIYKSEVLLAPAEENSGGGLSSLAGGLGGLASFAGVNLGGGGADKTTIAIEILKSREFIATFVQKHDLLVPLMAVEDWDGGVDQLVFDKNVYDEVSKKWVRDPKPPRASEPSLQEAYRRFKEFFAVSKDQETGLVSVSVEYYSPRIAKEWVDLLIIDINAEVKRRDMLEAKNSIQYLTEQLDKTAISDMRAVFYELIEEQTKIVMFAEVRDEYVFKTIDRAVVPELKAKPKKALICVLGVVFGGMLSLLIVLTRYYFIGRASPAKMT